MRPSANRLLSICACCAVSRLLALLLFLFLAQVSSAEDAPEHLPDTELLTWNDDIASRMIDGIDRFLLEKLSRSADARMDLWKAHQSSPSTYKQFIDDNRKQLAHMLGIRKPRIAFDELELVATKQQSSLVGKGSSYSIYRVRWPVLEGVYAEGLLLTPNSESEVSTSKTSGGTITTKTSGAAASVVAIPDAGISPEGLTGLSEEVPLRSQYARRLAENGCRVLVPYLIDRQVQQRSAPGRPGGASLSNREFLHRPSFVLGRHLIGYEVQKVLAAVDYFHNQAGLADKIGVIGWGEGGLIALNAAALDKRIDMTMVSGHFTDRTSVWQEPIERNVFGLLERCGDAELAAMVASHSAMIIEASNAPEVSVDGQGAAPGKLVTPVVEDVQTEFARAETLLLEERKEHNPLRLVLSAEEQYKDGYAPPGSEEALASFLASITLRRQVEPLGPAPSNLDPEFDPKPRQQRQVAEIDRHTQQLIEESSYIRAEYFNGLETSSLEKFAETVAPYREEFATKVIGRFDDRPLAPNPRSRKAYENDKWTGYEVVLDVFPDVFAYGVLLMPKGIAEGETRPVVVCQHGLEGRPKDTIEGDHHAYHDFAAKLAEHGFIVFAPQNPYIFEDRFRTLQRKANPLGKTLFSIIVPQHQQIVDWLQTLPQVDSRRIAFYGLSYGGKTAMRVPALVQDYCLSICSADFNDWVWKNASTRSPYSYVWTGEYEIFEFNLGSTFNYAEMAALIAPRPFMVERGHFDTVAPDERVGYEFAKVRHLYAARLKLPEHCQIEWFDGPHTIHGQATFDFLHRHLQWPKPKASQSTLFPGMKLSYALAMLESNGITITEDTSAHVVEGDLRTVSYHLGENKDGDALMLVAGRRDDTEATIHQIYWLKNFRDESRMPKAIRKLKQIELPAIDVSGLQLRESDFSINTVPEDPYK